MSDIQADEVSGGFVMRSFALFGGEVFYASGGFQDFLGSFDSVLDAADFASGSYEWWHIFDMKKRRVVFQSNCQAYGAEFEYPKQVVI